MAVLPDRKPNQIYEALRADILAFQLAPEQALPERWLEERYGASRTPIRAALAWLETEGLVLRSDRIRRVAPLSIDEMREAISFRACIERQAVALFTPNATADQLDVLHELGTTVADPIEAGRPNVDGMLGAAEIFHLEIARMSGNRFIARAVEEVMMRLYRARYMAALSPERRLRASSDHVAILDAVRKRDSNRASDLLGDHIERSGAYLLEQLERVSSGSAPFRLEA
ncbi:GntR Transcriptional regulators [Rhabdaerophilaceae bacterium]